MAGALAALDEALALGEGVGARRAKALWLIEAGRPGGVIVTDGFAQVFYHAGDEAGRGPLAGPVAAAAGAGNACRNGVVAALNLFRDYEFIRQASVAGAPKYMEWYGAFGLMVTLVWLYLEVLRLLATNLSNKQIALAMGVSDETIKWHFKNLFRKLNAGSRAHLLQRARMVGMVD